MNSPRGTVLLAVLLVISGYLGVITSHVSGAPLFGLMGLAGFVFAAALIIGEGVAQVRAGFHEPREKRKPKQSAEYRDTIDGKPVPDPEKRRRPVASATDYRTL